MAASEPLRSPAVRSALGSRVAVGLFLAVVAIADIWAGGPAFATMVALGVMLVFREWAVMHRSSPWLMAAGLIVLLLVSALAHVGRPLDALMLLIVAAVGLSLLAFALGRPGKRWLSTGLLYAGLPAVALIWLRQQPDGFALVMWTMGLVWATDIFAYVAGRAIGGARIWPAISPNKTWAGLAGGMAAASLFSALFGLAAGWPLAPLFAALLGAGLAILAQAGDFFESWLKRRAGVKDSGRLLGAHGGVMDRVDGLVPVACAVALWVGLSPGQLGALPA